MATAPPELGDAMSKEFTEAILRALSQRVPFEQIVAVLQEHRDEGLTQQSAYEALEAMRTGLDDDTEDRVLEIMDIVSGFCAPHHRVWTTDETDPSLT